MTYKCTSHASNLSSGFAIYLWRVPLDCMWHRIPEIRTLFLKLPYVRNYQIDNFCSTTFLAQFTFFSQISVGFLLNFECWNMNNLNLIIWFSVQISHRFSSPFIRCASIVHPFTNWYFLYLWIDRIPRSLKLHLSVSLSVSHLSVIALLVQTSSSPTIKLPVVTDFDYQHNLIGSLSNWFYSRLVLCHNG